MTQSPLQEILAVFGQPLAGNPTQYAMEKAFARAGLDWRFVTLEVSPEDLADAIRGARGMGFRGFQLADPHRAAAAPLLGRLSERAALVGAVNCVTRIEQELFGDNTEGEAFLQALRPLLDPKDQRVLLVGAGAMARAIAVELALAGAAEILVVNRDEGRGSALASLLSEKTKTVARYLPWGNEIEQPAELQLVINATPVGAEGGRTRLPLKVAELAADTIVTDVNLPGTRLLREASEREMRVIDGLSLLANETCINFQKWTETSPDAELVRESLEEFLGV